MENYVSFNHYTKSQAIYFGVSPSIRRTNLFFSNQLTTTISKIPAMKREKTMKVLDTHQMLLCISLLYITTVTRWLQHSKLCLTWTMVKCLLLPAARYIPTMVCFHNSNNVQHFPHNNKDIQPIKSASIDRQVESTTTDILEMIINLTWNFIICKLVMGRIRKKQNNCDAHFGSTALVKKHDHVWWFPVNWLAKTPSIYFMI